MQDSKSKPTKPLRYIILDTNIFKSLSNPELKNQIIYILQDAVKSGYGIAISKYTIFELLDTASIQNEIAAMKAINGLKHFKITQTILVAAGHLGCLYLEDKIEYNEDQKGDKIIAATSVVNNAVIFTINGRDFPRPFFKELSRPILHYSKKDGSEVHLTSYFLEPDLEIIKLKYDERQSKMSLKAKHYNKQNTS